MKLRASFIPQVNEILQAQIEEWGAANNVPVAVDIVSMNDIQTLDRHSRPNRRGSRHHRIESGVRPHLCRGVGRRFVTLPRTLVTATVAGMTRPLRPVPVGERVEGPAPLLCRARHQLPHRRLREDRGQLFPQPGKKYTSSARSCARPVYRKWLSRSAGPLATAMTSTTRSCGPWRVGYLLTMARRCHRFGRDTRRTGVS